MHIKIQGGSNGEYSNIGTSYGVVTYLRHEDKELLEQDRRVEPFFSYDKDFVPPTEVVESLDSNKAKLSRSDAKFFVLTVSPSKEELLSMGTTPEEQTEAFKKYINTEVMTYYAHGFGKNLEAKDILYYGKIHHARGEKVDDQMHAHIIVSRKDKSNKIKLSPQTNHKNTKKGAIRGGFNRTSFYQNVETAFDKHFRYDRDFADTFEYKNVLKNGTIPQKIAMEVKMHRQELLSEPKQINPAKHKELDIQTEDKNHAAFLDKLECEVTDAVLTKLHNGDTNIDKFTVNELVREFAPTDELGVKNPFDALDMITNNNREQFEMNLYSKVDVLLDAFSPQIKLPQLEDEEEQLAKKRKRGRGMGR